MFFFFRSLLNRISDTSDSETEQNQILNETFDQQSQRGELSLEKKTNQWLKKQKLKGSISKSVQASGNCPKSWLSMLIKS